jgi:hypothetical protein
MSRRVRAVAALAALLVALCASGPIPLEVLGLPSPGDVIRVIDTLTKKDSPTSVNVKVGATASQGKLLIARTSVNVEMERSSRNWRGRVVVTMSVPTAITYSVNLADIRAEHVRLDPERKAVVIAMPGPRVEDVTPLLANLKADSTFKRARFKRLDADTGRELQNEMLRHDYLLKARQKGEERIDAVREPGRRVLQAFLEKLLQGTAPGARVIVE